MIQLLVLVTLLVGAGLTGMLWRTLSGRRLRGAAALAFDLLIGALFWVLALSVLSTAGLSTRVSARLLVLGLALMAVPASWRWWANSRTRRPRARRRPDLLATSLLVAALLSTAVVGLLPVLWSGGFASENDSWLYCGFSEWLQDHPFLGPETAPPDAPITVLPVLYRRWHLPLGATYTVALAQTLSGRSSLEVYPSASTLALVLSTAAIFLAARWALRLSRRAAAAVALAFALLPHPLTWGHHNGFLSQTWASAALLLLLALLARLPWLRGSWEALALGLPMAFLLVVYLPFAPVAAAVTAVWVVTGLRLSRRAGQFGRFLSRSLVLVAFVMLCAHREILSLWRGVRLLSQVQVGSHVGLSPREFAEFGFGLSLLGNAVGSRIRAAAQGWSFVVAALLLLLVGLGVMARRRRVRPLLVALGFFVALLAYYAGFCRDPWTGVRGHTWSLFKLLQWQYPLVLLFQSVGALTAIRWAARRLRPADEESGRRIAQRTVFAAGLCGAGVLVCGIHVPWALALGQSQADLLREERPLSAVPGIRRALASLPAGRLLLLGRPVNRAVCFGAHAALLAWPRPIVADWWGSAGLETIDISATARLYAEGLASAGRHGWVALGCEWHPGDEPGAKPVGAGCAYLLPQADPQLVGVASPGKMPGPAGPAFVTAPGRTKLLVLASRPMSALVRLRLAPARASDQRRLAAFLLAGDYDPPALRAAVASRPVYEAGILVTREHVFQVPLAAGLSTIVLILRPGAGSQRPEAAGAVPIESLLLEPCRQRITPAP